MWYVYIVRNGLGHLYTGITTDPQRRLAEHQAGKGAKALRGKGPLRQEYCAAIGSRSAASQVEYWIKQLPRKQKLALISGVLPLPQRVRDDGA